MVTKELDFVYITEDGKRFLLKEQAEKHEQKLKDGDIKSFSICTYINVIQFFCYHNCLPFSLVNFL